MTERNIRSELAGSVCSIELQPGVRVDPDDVVLLIESMKMEMPVVAGAAGTLLEVRVVVGQTVQEGDVLAVVST